MVMPPQIPLLLFEPNSATKPLTGFIKPIRSNKIVARKQNRTPRTPTMRSSKVLTPNQKWIECLRPPDGDPLRLRHQDSVGYGVSN